MSKQTYIVRIDMELARRVRNLLMHSEHGYASIDELVEVALTNQLNAEHTPVDDGGARLSVPTQDPNGHSYRVRMPEIGSATHKLLVRPPPTAPSDLVSEPAVPTQEAFFVLTNRLSPIKVATRVLSNLASDSGWPELESFQSQAAEAARSLGLYLKALDEASSTSRKRWIAYPFGADAEKAKRRFVVSFTIGTSGNTLTGPMALLGLANLDGNRVGLTRSGWRLAAAPSPLLDGSEGTTLSPAETEILRERLASSHSARTAVSEFIRFVADANGSQDRIDELLAAVHSQWSSDLVVAERSAMLGRLADLGALEVAGRGSKAVVRLLPLAVSFSGSTQAIAS